MVQRSFRMLQQLRAVRNDVLPAVCYRREKRREERGKLYQVRHLLRAWLRRSLVDDENPRTDQSGQRNRCKYTSKPHSLNLQKSLLLLMIILKDKQEGLPAFAALCTTAVSGLTFRLG